MSLQFHTLITYLAPNQLPYKPKNDFVDCSVLCNGSSLTDHPGCEIVTSYQDNFTIINALLNSFTLYPTEYSRLKQSLKEYLVNYSIVHQSMLKEFELNYNKLTYYLDSEYSHDDLVMLAAIAFQINILVISNLGNRIYSPVSLNQFYLVLHQDEHLKFHAVKFQLQNGNMIDYLIGNLNLIPPYHPFLGNFLDLT